MQDVREIARLQSPAPFPQALGFDGNVLWLSSRETRHLYAIDPHTWAARDEGQAPGTPYGLTITGDELRVVCGVAPDDDRFIYRFAPGPGFRTDIRIACPDDAGSYLAYDGRRLYLTQFYRRKILALDAAGTITSTIDVPHDICGCVAAGDAFYLVTTDDEKSTDYWLTRVDPREEPVARDLARIPFAARSLAYDGQRFWTNHRERHEVVAFTL